MPLDNQITADFSQFAGEEAKIDWSASRQWASRPTDERYTSLDAMLAMLDQRTDRSIARNVSIGALRPTLTAEGDVAFDLGGDVLEPTNYSFAQIGQEVGVPTGFLTSKLAGAPRLVAEVMQHAFDGFEDLGKEVQVLQSHHDLRGVTGPNYGRIWDHEIVRAVKRVCEESGARWQVPVAFAMPGTVKYDYVPTTEETTLYASDRDVYMFLVDQENPIECGFITNPKTGGREPDVYSRGFMAWNGECGGVSNGVATFLYRWCCSNRSIRDQKGFQRVSIAHRANAAELFATRLLPALKGFVNGATTGIAASIEAAKQARVARDDDSRLEFLTKALDLGAKEAAEIMAISLKEESRPIETVFDTVQAMTAWARQIGHQDRRVLVERNAGKLMSEVSRQFEMA